MGEPRQASAIACLSIFGPLAKSATSEFQITTPRANSVIPGEVIEVSGVGTDPSGTVGIEVLTEISVNIHTQLREEMSVSRKEYRLTNKAAHKLEEEELFRELRDCFSQKNLRAPLKDEAEGLREAANWIKTNLASWRVFERGINEETWDPAKGAGDVFSQGH